LLDQFVVEAGGNRLAQGWVVEGGLAGEQGEKADIEGRTNPFFEFSPLGAAVQGQLVVDFEAA
jgi:hypothetical protein